MSGLRTTLAGHWRRRWWIMLALIGCALTGQPGSAQTWDPGVGWSLIGDKQLKQNQLSFSPSGNVWQARTYIDTLDVSGGARGRWIRLNLPFFSRNTPIHFISSDTLMVADRQLWRSSDRGRSFERLSGTPGMVYRPPEGSQYHYRILSGKSSPLLYSDDRGTTFRAPTAPNTLWSGGLRAFAAFPSVAGPWGSGPSVRPGRLLAGSFVWGVGVSDDGGETWHESGLWSYPVGINYVTVLARTPAQGGGLRIVAIGTVEGTPGFHVWTSDDGGDTFRETALLFDTLGVTQSGALVALVPVVPGEASGPSNAAPSWQSSEALVLFQNGRLMRTVDGGLTFQYIDGPQGQVPIEVPGESYVLSLSISADGHLYPAASRAGPDAVWQIRSSEAYVTAAEAPAVRTLAASVGPVVPNPTAGRATLTLALPEAARVTVDLFDAVGRLVHSGTASEHSAGASSASLDMSGLAPGVYVARVTIQAPGGASSVSRRFVVAH